MDPLNEYRDQLLRLDRGLGNRDQTTSAHSVRVGRSARILGRSLGLPRAELETLTWAARLHDVGKLGIPLATLDRAGPLSPTEWEEVRRHPSAGADLVLEISPRLAAVASGIRAHHERWDGGGYPYGLAGNEISLHGRIIAIVDVFDAVTHPRCYREGVMTAEEALLLILDGSGTQFDAALVPAFVIAVLQGWPTAPQRPRHLRVVRLPAGPDLVTHGQVQGRWRA
ncbi:MAG TPA: HD-GYP domain-containing protein [Actinomycetes bacterium]